MSLNDIEHRILRGRFREPRIHFAINCASNGCPPMRPQAYEPEGIRSTLNAATRQFLASEWNCRIDDAERRIYVSRIFRMYAEDFAGEVDSTVAYREGVLPPSVTARIAVEQASTFGWARYVGMSGEVIGMTTFGASAPLKELQKKFGFTPENVEAAALKALGRSR